MFKLKKSPGIPRERLPFAYLAAAGIIEFLFIVVESCFSYLPYYLAETWIIAPCLLFLGYALQQELSDFARRRLLLAGAAVGWFFVVQCIHKLSGMENHPMATVLFVYLMAFPFAAVSDDREYKGLWWIGGMFVVSSLILVFYTVILMLGLVPEALWDNLYWDGARLHAFWHPNIAASYFMIGIGFSGAFCVMTQKKSVKYLLMAAIAAQLAAMALTNCRTTLLLTGALLGGLLFLLIFKGGWKQFVLGIAVAAVVLVGTFKVSGVLYRWNNDRLVAASVAYQETVEPAEEIAVQQDEPEQTGIQVVLLSDVVMTEVEPQQNTEILQGENQQGTLANDMRTLNGRTYIWKSALNAIRDNKKLALWGTEYVGTVISVYNFFEVVHSHNSWIEALMRMGLPGLMMSLVFTVLSVWSAARLILSRRTELWKKVIAMLTMCVMAAGFLEPYLFITNVYYHVTDFAFFFLTGYLDYWCRPGTRQKT